MSILEAGLSIIILNWNAAVDTIRCVRQVAAWQRLSPTIWVVDNGSTDDSIEAISRECPDAHLIHSSSNLGFAGGNNKGIERALAGCDAPILLLNNDASVSERDVIRLLDTLRSDEKIGFVGPLLFDADNNERLLAAGGRDPVRHHQSHIMKMPSEEPVHGVEYVPGTVLLARPEVFRKVGLLDERYFFTMEIADLCMRAREQGYLSVVDARARAFHALSRSSEQRETLHAYYIIRNRFLFISKFHTDRRVQFYVFWALYSLALLARVQLGGNQVAAQAIWTGLLDGLRGRFGGQNQRVLRPRRQNRPS
ncbi:MAG: glycosyltransferase family 2 protein [bacterium]